MFVRSAKLDRHAKRVILLCFNKLVPPTKKSDVVISDYYGDKNLWAGVTSLEAGNALKRLAEVSRASFKK